MFIVTNSIGQRLLETDNIFVAIDALKLRRDSFEVIRASDGVRLAYKGRPLSFSLRKLLAA